MARAGRVPVGHVAFALESVEGAAAYKATFDGSWLVVAPRGRVDRTVEGAVAAFSSAA